MAGESGDDQEPKDSPEDGNTAAVFVIKCLGRVLQKIYNLYMGSHLTIKSHCHP